MTPHALGQKEVNPEQSEREEPKTSKVKGSPFIASLGNALGVDLDSAARSIVAPLYIVRYWV